MLDVRCSSLLSPKLIIYLAKGPANSCGPGCDHWIAVEGKVDQGAVVRKAARIAAPNSSGTT